MQPAFRFPHRLESRDRCFPCCFGVHPLSETLARGAMDRGLRREDMGLIAQSRQKGYHILDLFWREDRLTAPSASDTGEPRHPVVGRHDRVRVEAGWIDQTQ